MPAAKTKKRTPTLQALATRLTRLEEANRTLTRTLQDYTRDRIGPDYDITPAMEAEWDRRLKAMLKNPARRLTLEELKKPSSRSKAS